MIECLKRIIREYQNFEPPDGLLPRRVAIGSLPGKVSVVTGVGEAARPPYSSWSRAVFPARTSSISILPTTGFTGCGTKIRTSSWRLISRSILRSASETRLTAFSMKFIPCHTDRPDRLLGDSLADPRVKQSEVRSLSESMVEMAMADHLHLAHR